jgi:hypothetical protein
MNRIFVTDNSNGTVNNGSLEMPADCAVNFMVRGLSFVVSIKNNRLVVYQREGLAIKPVVVAKNQIEI